MLRKKYAGMATNQRKVRKQILKENNRLRRAVSDLTSEKLIPSEAA